MFQNQYRFIYSAISEYVELYRSKDEEYAYSVPVNAMLPAPMGSSATSSAMGSLSKASSSATNGRNGSAASSNGGTMISNRSK